MSNQLIEGKGDVGGEGAPDCSTPPQEVEGRTCRVRYVERRQTFVEDFNSRPYGLRTTGQLPLHY